MTIFLLYLFLFIVGSLSGWIIEVFFRRFFSAKKWVNPGFMKGPWLPLYGFGVIVMFTMCYLVVSFFPESMHFYNPLGGLFGHDYVSAPKVADLIPIALMWIGMVTLEFLAGLIFIKGFHVKLWDYSNLKGNVMGIICPLFNIIWLTVAVIFYYGINPFLYLGASKMYKFMFGDSGTGLNFGFIFVMGIAYGIMIWDFSTSIGLFARISKFSKESGIIEKYEAIKDRWEEINKDAKNKLFNGKEKHKRIDNTKLETLKEKIAESVYIDPEKEKDKDSNYDESGRPVKTD
ncbi:MAG: putative ABC transporter permease [Bacilli bacterium]|nr:putative ABC transporter permease [Bacilli bacterium]